MATAQTNHERGVLVIARHLCVGPHLTDGRRYRRLTPGDAETLHRLFVDLIERRVFRPGIVGAVRGPISGRRCLLHTRRR